MYTGVYVLSKDADLTQGLVVRGNSAGLTSTPTRVSRLGDPYEKNCWHTGLFSVPTLS